LQKIASDFAAIIDEDLQEKASQLIALLRRYVSRRSSLREQAADLAVLLV
jgi:hypothetical protein